MCVAVDLMSARYDLDLAFLAEYVVFVAPTPLQAAIYTAVCGSKEAKNAYEGVQKAFGGGVTGLQLITLLRKVANSPGLLLRDRDAVRSQCPSRKQETLTSGLAGEVFGAL